MPEIFDVPEQLISPYSLTSSEFFSSGFFHALSVSVSLMLESVNLEGALHAPAERRNNATISEEAVFSINSFKPPHSNIFSK